MYNLTVDTAHTFFVGEGQWLVHNACPPYNRGAFGDFDPDVRKFVFERDNYTCVYCGSRDDLTLDHLYPAKKIWGDGAWKWTFEQRNSWFNNVDNLVTACRGCNSSKGASDLSEWLEKLMRRKGME
jgi:5-methylcytosine-specific restriction endonuclease McrA